MQCEGELFFFTAAGANLSAALGELNAAIHPPNAAVGFRATWSGCCSARAPPAVPQPLPVPPPAPPPPPPPPAPATTPPCEQPRFAGAPYCNRTLPAVERADMLIAVMSLEEKVALLQNVNVGVPRLGVMPLRFGEALHDGLKSNTLTCVSTENAILFWAPVINLCRDARWVSLVARSAERGQRTG